MSVIFGLLYLIRKDFDYSGRSLVLRCVGMKVGKYGDYEKR